jgi:hypothetical protein
MMPMQAQCRFGSAAPGGLGEPRVIRHPALAVFLGLAGCAGGVPVERQVAVSGAGFANVDGEVDLVVRAFLAPEDEVRREVVGAVCQVESTLYEAQITTPSRLKVPNFGPQSPELDISCSADGFSGRVRQEINTYWRDAPGYYGYPYGGWYPPPVYGGAAFAWGYGGWWGPSYPVSDYPNVSVILR